LLILRHQDASQVDMENLRLLVFTNTGPDNVRFVRGSARRYSSRPLQQIHDRFRTLVRHGSLDADSRPEQVNVLALKLGDLDLNQVRVTSACSCHATSNLRRRLSLDTDTLIAHTNVSVKVYGL
jgi:hypothetical protein